MHTLLLIDDDRTLCQMFREFMEPEKFIVFEASTGHRSLDILRHHHVDLVLLDIGLPDGSGLDFIEEIRNVAKIPMVVMSGNPDSAVHVKAFEAGADDFMQKPFHLKEMRARINSHLKRAPSNQNRPMPVAGGSEKIRFAGWLLDPDKYQIFDNDNHAGTLTAHEFQILKLLIDNMGKVLKREDLCEALRADNYCPTPRAIDIKIARIRKKLGDDAHNPQIIKTVRGAGYLVDITP
ncbi:MAG TPA: response regulator transcription factor [Alphaproteobacteria bacterium]|nr:response regulator transcription factor [Alphaproteobacteria bacterium]